ncbi:ABC transporter ATP-binding protein [Aggregatilineales bacterium SYSU G02658]
MNTLELEQIGKTYGTTTALHPLDLDVAEGEFVSLLGPSGCGKTTLLRMVAGFITPTSGLIRLQGQVITSANGPSLPPEKRGIGMVFQSYAVWPHKTVFENVAYPLRLRRMARKDVQKEVSDVLEMVKLGALAHRYPHELSGGQQQRVALARALVMRPRILLLDEPLSNLDAKLREDLRYELIALQQRFHMTIIYVTHDQLEAITMSSRIVVLKDGYVQQIGQPQDIYASPANRFVAEFVGAGSFLPCDVLEVEARTATLRIEGHVMPVQLSAPTSTGAGVLFVRPNQIQIGVPDSGGLPARLVQQVFLGDRWDSLIEVSGKLIHGHHDLPLSFAPDSPVALHLREGLILRD